MLIQLCILQPTAHTFSCIEDEQQQLAMMPKDNQLKEEKRRNSLKEAANLGIKAAVDQGAELISIGPHVDSMKEDWSKGKVAIRGLANVGPELSSKKLHFCNTKIYE